MSEGEKLNMDKKAIAAAMNGRQLQLQGDCKKDNATTVTKNFVQNVRRESGSRRDFGSRPANEPLAAKKYTAANSYSRGGGGSGGGYDRKIRAPRDQTAKGSFNCDERNNVTSAGLDVESCSPEYGSVQAWGHKKSNCNHLLNFHFESRSGEFGLPPGVVGRHYHQVDEWKRGGKGRGGKGGSYPRSMGGGYNKERFLQANCQFIVREGGDYSVHAYDPDRLVDWDLIEQVRVLSHEVPSCPICLYPPRAAKMTRCGHVYCWTCILHYLSLDDRTWRKCPICYESVHEKDLKSVTAVEAHLYTVGDEITMRLMKKGRGDVRVAPRQHWLPSDGLPCSLIDASLGAYAKLLTADTEQVNSVLRGERLALEQQLREEPPDSLESSYINAALATLFVRESNCNIVHGLPCSTAGIELKQKVAALQQQHIQLPMNDDKNSVTKHASAKPYKTYTSAFSDEECNDNSKSSDKKVIFVVDDESEELEQALAIAVTAAKSEQADSNIETDASTATPNHAAAKDVENANSETEREAAEVDCMGILLDGESVSSLESSSPKQTSMSASAVDSDGAFYFYQAVDGQHIYMNPLNVRCIIRQYGSLASAPEFITATIMELEPVSMDEDVRRRLRVLNHLPLTCQFMMAELDLKPPLLSTEVLDHFADEIDRRSRVRQRREREDRQRARRIQADENRKLGIDPFVRVVRSDYKGNGAAAVTAVTPVNDSSVAVSHSPPSIVTTYGSLSSDDGLVGSCGGSEGGQRALSFAQMLKAGAPKPSVGSLKAWCRPASDPSMSSESRRGRYSASGGEGASDDECNELCAAPRYEDSWSSSIQAALDNLDQQSHDASIADGMNNGESSSSGNKNKKKKVKKLLFTTSMARNK